MSSSVKRPFVALSGTPRQYVSHPLRFWPPKMATALTAKIKAAFERSGLTQRDLANAVGVDESTVSLWLSGERTPRVKNLERLARAMGLEASELWNGPEATPATEIQAKVLEDMNFLSPTQQEVVAALVRSMRHGG